MASSLLIKPTKKMALVRSVAAVAAKRLLGSNQLTTTTRIVNPLNTIKTVGSISDVLVQKRGIHSTVARCSEEEKVIRLGAEEWFAKFKEDVLDSPGPIGGAMDGILRNTVRMTCEIHAPQFGSLPLFLGKNLAFIQLVLLDTDRSIQGKLYMTGSQVQPTAPDLITCSRKLFKEAVPYLLKDTKQWIFSRSLVFQGYTGVIDEAVKFSEYDPVGGLLKPPLQPSGIRCAEAFLFVAGDFEVKEDGLSTREAVKDLLHELNSREGISKLLGFDCVAASVVVPDEKLEELKGTHLSMIA